MSEGKKCKLGDFLKVKHITAEETSDVLVTTGSFYIGGGFISDK